MGISLRLNCTRRHPVIMTRWSRWRGRVNIVAFDRRSFELLLSVLRPFTVQSLTQMIIMTSCSFHPCTSSEGDLSRDAASDKLKNNIETCKTLTNKPPQ
jgi:hypothetical protein